MNIFEAATYAVMKRPFILVLIGVLMLALAIGNAIVPVMAMIMGIISMTGGGIFDGILSVLAMLIDPAILPTLLLLLVAGTLLVSVAAGLLLPGYLLIVADGIAQGEKQRGLFLQGLKSHFLRIFLITVKTVLLAAVLALFLMVAGVPGIVVTKAAFSTKPDLLIAAVFIDIVTAGVLFMSLSFFRAYVYMWYLSAVNGLEKPFKTGKAMADKGFWKLSFGLLAFDAVFAGVLYTIYLSESQLFRYTAGWAFATLFFTILAVYLVRFFRENR
jgi:hypothetical protein